MSMGQTLISIPFWTDDIKVHPHSATKAEHLRPITLREFVGSQRAVLRRIEETGEYHCYRQDGAFIEGPEV